MKIFIERVNGFGIIMLILGMVGQSLIEWKMLIIVVPLFLTWVMKYDDASYEHKERNSKHG